MGADKIKYAYSNGTVFFKAVKKVKDNQEKTTLGDISALSDLKDKMDGKK